MDWLPRGPLARELKDEYSADDLLRIRQQLEQAGTFRFPTFPSGLFAASISDAADFEVTGYQYVWVRDTVQIAHAHFVIGEVEVAVKAARSLAAFLCTQQPKLRAIIAGELDPCDPMDRPHIRFDGHRLTEVDEKWAHAQNDALGYFLWLFSRLVIAGRIQPTAEEWSLLADFPRYFQAVRYWEDEDSGHWEEVRKVAASSIGVVVAALVEYARLTQHPAASQALQATGVALEGHALAELLEEGGKALESILPAECMQEDTHQRRRYDAALLFLIYPLKLMDGPMAEAIVEDVTTHLLGDYGIRRYLGDSYWCADYKTLLSPESRTADFSDNIDARDQLLQPGLEAQWCIFDPIISVIYGLRAMKSNDPDDRRLQTLFLNRSLGQLTTEESRFGAYRCPESYYRENGEYVPNDITPLLWTQANLRLALHWAELTAAGRVEG